MNDVMPECLRTSSNAYPYCFGAKYPYCFAENDCYTCPWYSEYWRACRDRELAEKEFDFIKEIEIIENQL